MTRRIALNLETSGLNPLAGSEIIMICALEVLDDRQSGAAFQTLTKPVRPLTQVAEELTGITNAMLAKAPSFAEIAADFLDFVADAEVVCINAPFDSAFLSSALADIELSPLQAERFVDLWRKLPSEFRQHGSDAIYDYAGIKRNPAASPSQEVTRLYWALIPH